MVVVVVVVAVVEVVVVLVVDAGVVVDTVVEVVVGGAVVLESLHPENSTVIATRVSFLDDIVGEKKLGELWLECMHGQDPRRNRSIILNIIYRDRQGQD